MKSQMQTTIPNHISVSDSTKMVRAIEEEKQQQQQQPRFFNFKGLFDNGSGGTKSPPSNDMISDLDNKTTNPSPNNTKPPDTTSASAAQTPPVPVKPPNPPPPDNEADERLKKDMEMMKEKFAKLLLGEDMSGGGKGVSSALALSNAITNLAASAFGEQRRLEPMQPETRIRWKKEIDWLLSVTDYIVEMVPVKQKAKDGSMMEVMTTRQRTDLLMNIPALRKLDTMLIDCLENFKDQNEFTYVSKTSADDSSKSNDKWWIPTPKVPPNGLSEATRKWIQCQKDSVNQVLKAAMAINAMVLAEMEIPENYIDSLPKNGRSSLGESVYRNITVDHFDPDHFLLSMDLASELKILDLKNRIEASIVIWKRKMTSKDNKSAWGSAVTLEKREQFEDRAETILLIIKHRFPGIPQSSLEISKIQYNKDVGQAILESYSRIIESLAFTVLSRIDDVINADAQTRNPPVSEQRKSVTRENGQAKSSIKSPIENQDLERQYSGGTPTSMTLFDFMDWRDDQADSDQKDSTSEDGKLSKKGSNVDSNRRYSYTDNLGSLRSPTARH